MVDFLVAATLSNLLVSTILAVLAWGVQRRIPSPGLANLLWAIVLIKLVTPPIVAIPALTVPSIAGPSNSTNAKHEALPKAELRNGLLNSRLPTRNDERQGASRR